MEKKKTIVLGASANPEKESYLAVSRLVAQGHPVIAIGNKAGVIGNTNIETGEMPAEDVDTVTLYLNPNNQKSYYHYIFSLHPKRIIFNPGAENEELYGLALEKGIKAQEACTIVLLITGQF